MKFFWVRFFTFLWKSFSLICGKICLRWPEDIFCKSFFFHSNWDYVSTTTSTTTTTTATTTTTTIHKTFQPKSKKCVGTPFSYNIRNWSSNSNPSSYWARTCHIPNLFPINLHFVECKYIANEDQTFENIFFEKLSMTFQKQLLKIREHCSFHISTFSCY